MSGISVTCQHDVLFASRVRLSTITVNIHPMYLLNQTRPVSVLGGYLSLFGSRQVLHAGEYDQRGPKRLACGDGAETARNMVARYKLRKVSEMYCHPRRLRDGDMVVQACFISLTRLGILVAWLSNPYVFYTFLVRNSNIPRASALLGKPPQKPLLQHHPAVQRTHIYSEMVHI